MGEREYRSDLVRRCCEWFQQRELRLGLAESCTGGLISSWIVERPGVSDFYQGSVVSYDLSVKMDVLEVSSETVERCGVVSEPVALEMARGARRCLGSDWSLGVTGWIGPADGLDGSSVGTVCFGVAGPHFEKSVLKKFNKKERVFLQQESAEFALEFLWESLSLIQK